MDNKIRSQLSSKPSSTRVRGEVKDARDRMQARINRFGGDVETEESKPSLKGWSAEKKDQALMWFGSLAAVGMIVAVAATAKYNDVKPVDVAKLPPDQVTNIKIGYTGSDTPSGVAGLVINNETDLGQVTAEIEDEIDGAKVVSPGTVLKLPTNQVDPAAVKVYESGQPGQ